MLCIRVRCYTYVLGRCILSGVKRCIRCCIDMPGKCMSFGVAEMCHVLQICAMCYRDVPCVTEMWQVYLVL